MSEDTRRSPVPWIFSLKSNTQQSSQDRASAAKLPADTLGLALSGGGIRSATFCLGVIQALAQANWLRHVDFMSTVSGGGYVGSFVGRYFDVLKIGGMGNPGGGRVDAQARVRTDLIDSQSPPLSWLRRHSNYLSPAGISDQLRNLSTFWRNFLTLHCLLAIFFFTLFGFVNLCGYFLESWRDFNDVGVAFAPFTTWITRITGSAIVPSWILIGELVFWFSVVALMLGYWLVSSWFHGDFVWRTLVAAGLVVSLVAVRLATPLSIGILAAAIVWVLYTWLMVKRTEGNKSFESRLGISAAKNLLSEQLAAWTTTFLCIAGIALVDAVGQWVLFSYHAGQLSGPAVAAWFASALAVLAPLLRALAMFFARRDPGRSLRVSPAQKIPVLSELTIFILGGFLPLVILAFLSHLAFGGGYELRQGAIVTVCGVLICLLLGSGEAMSIVNGTGPLTIYAARLSRAYLGAINPRRRAHPNGANVARVVPGDDVPFDEYAPHSAGGPLHLVNCALNETVDLGSRRGTRERKAENLAVGPAGLSVGPDWHGVWILDQSIENRPDSSGEESDLGKKNERVSPRLRMNTRRTRKLRALQPIPELHPLVDTTGEPIAFENLNLRQWMGISGAAVSPGMGSRTKNSLSLLYTLGNVRLGYWLDSKLGLDRLAYAHSSYGLNAHVWKVLKKTLRTQGLLTMELLGRFCGPWGRFWYLSDGGHFEMTGAYELLRRRVPYVIVCDAGRDEHQRGDDLAQLVRLARLDFGAEFHAIDLGADLSEYTHLDHVRKRLSEKIGQFKDLLATEPGGLSAKHAALFRIDYATRSLNSAAAWNGRTCTWMLYIKASCVGDEPEDIRAYRAGNPSFPNESTGDQYFDEAQWESYRKLGEHIGQQLFLLDDGIVR